MHTFRFFYDKENVGMLDAYLRSGAAVVLFYLFFAGEYPALLLALPLSLMVTALNRSCPLYHLAGINRSRLRRRTLVNYLPLYNPSPVFVFERDGTIGFQNEISRKLLPEIEQIQDFRIKEYETLTFQYAREETTYLINCRFVPQLDAIFAYATDISRIVALQNEIERAQIEIVDMMGMIAESRSKETGMHIRRVAEYSRLIALKLGMDEEEAELLRIASPMHDIGKVGIPDRILNKPGRLTPEEFEIMKSHARIGYEMLQHSQSAIIKAAATIAYEHHEKYDGSGYPRRLRGEEIHIYGRITAVADVFDALGSDRVYKKAWPLDRIIKLFKEERGRHFDPRIVDILLTHLDEFLVIRDRYQDHLADASSLEGLLDANRSATEALSHETA